MAQAAIKQTELDEAFEQWCKQQDEATTDKLTEIYNTAFNSIVERQIDVSTFDYFPNAAHTKKPREHQKSGLCVGCKARPYLRMRSAPEKRSRSFRRQWKCGGSE